jgi:alkylated DNA repair dioxygenase AlkB
MQPDCSDVTHWRVVSNPGTLYGAHVPSGFLYQPDFMTDADETALADEIGRLEFSRFEMRGVVARRRVAFFGRTYDAVDAVASPLPAFLEPLRNTVAGWAGVNPQDFSMALVNEYRPGAPIGWHRDAPQYDIVAGISLLSDCRMKFRPYIRPTARKSKSRVRRTTTHEITLERRSAYLMTGESRNAYEHHIPAISTLRYSITFRTARP